MGTVSKDCLSCKGTILFQTIWKLLDLRNTASCQRLSSPLLSSEVTFIKHKHQYESRLGCYNRHWKPWCRKGQHQICSCCQCCKKTRCCCRDRTKIWRRTEQAHRNNIEYYKARQRNRRIET